MALSRASLLRNDVPRFLFLSSLGVVISHYLIHKLTIPRHQAIVEISANGISVGMEGPQLPLKYEALADQIWTGCLKSVVYF